MSAATPAFIAATTLLSPSASRFTPGNTRRSLHQRSFAAAVALPPPPRRLTPAPSPKACASSDDASFFLPADGRGPSRANSSPDSVPMSIAARRVAEKAKSIANSAPSPGMEDDELRRSQLVSEELSAADLFSSVSDLSVADLSGSIVTPPDTPPSTPPDIPPEAQNAFLSPETPPNAASSKTQTRIKASSNSVKRRRRKPPAPGTPVKIASAATPQAVSSSPSPPQPESASQASPPSSPSPTAPSKEGQLHRNSLSVGSLVKHERHGIGRFCGLERTRSRFGFEKGPVQEFVVLEYRDGDVYVPLSHLELITLLSDAEVRLVSRLDVISPSAAYPTTHANRRRANYLARRRTREKIRKQIVNLHAMYAQRTTLERKPIPVNKRAEKEFSKSCQFELTEDQASATEQVFRDMSENNRPMDRLLCGDVGFGKTEVAIRAAFRALSAGLQVAVLAPTTILAQQHYETFRDRFASHPEIRIACLTRFVVRRKVVEAREDAKEGTVDIAIGTHMLLSDSFSFKRLGLLIVDEEHRFGVNQKEKIRARYRTIDTLFLSATPIPRTLHLALSGLRDASVLRTPPRGRKPVITRTSRLGAGVVRSAISKEIQRGGQVFYVVPRIEGIEGSADWIRDMIPDLRVMVAHGGMKDLERRIVAFAKQEYDVLVCTTIIENGINMPDVNTIVIQDANKFGLAQLHQLRGRVGRSDRQAYAWVLYTETQASNLAAIERLKTLEKHTALGSGFAIAQRDMEMRGVGTVLGVEQHGNNSVNADDYARMLAEELESARTGKPIPMTLPTVENVEIFLPVASLIPEEYISDLDEKMRVYRQLAEAKSYEELDREVGMLRRSKGEVPPALQRHVSILRVKLCARKLGIGRVVTERQHVILEWQLEAAAFKRLVMFVDDQQARARCEHLEAEERVVIRGLGICSGDVQLAKMLQVLEAMSKAAEGIRSEAAEQQPALAQALDQWGGSSIAFGV